MYLPVSPSQPRTWSSSSHPKASSPGSLPTLVTGHAHVRVRAAPATRRCSCSTGYRALLFAPSLKPDSDCADSESLSAQRP
eukprot:2937730-Rhodomonas_salina.1